MLALLALFGPNLGCDGNSSSGTGASSTTATGDPLADAPAEFDKFLVWASDELNTTPPAAPLPKSPALSAPRWPVIRLVDLVAGAKIESTWAPRETEQGALFTIGPVQSDRPGGGLQVQTGETPEGPMMLMRFPGITAQREQVGLISLEIHQPFGDYFELHWSRAGKIRIPLPDNERPWKFKLSTDGFAEWEGPLDQFAILLPGTGPGIVKVESLRFLPAVEAFAAAAGQRRHSLGREARDVVYQHAGTEVRFPGVHLPENAKFATGLGLAGSSDTGPDVADGTVRRAEVRVEKDGRSDTVWSDGITRTAHWRDVTVSLASWGGQTVDLVLWTSEESDPSVVCWGDATVYQPIDDPPRVVIYLIDALGAKHADLYGYGRQTMPNLARMAEDGVWLANMFSNSSRTVESIPDLMLSLPTEQHGVHYASIRAPLQLVTLAEALRAGGFATASFCTNVNAGPRQNMDQGFDSFFDRIAYWWSGEADRTVPIEDVIAWLKFRADRPTFTYIHTAEPHAPYTPRREYAEQFSTGYSGPLDGTYDPRTGFRNSRSTTDLQHVVSLYDAEAAYADARLAAFRSAWSQAGLSAPAAFFVTADHGEEFLEHGSWEHGDDLHTELTRVPLVAAGTRIAARGRVETPAQLFDLMPTILEMFELRAPYALTGASLLPLLQAGNSGAPAELAERPIISSNFIYFSKSFTEFTLLSEGRWKLMHLYPQSPAGRMAGSDTSFVLYDVQQDPDERRNLLAEQPGRARALIEQLVRWRHANPPFEVGVEGDSLLFDSEQLNELRSLGYVE